LAFMILRLRVDQPAKGKTSRLHRHALRKHMVFPGNPWDADEFERKRQREVRLKQKTEGGVEQ